MNKNKYILVKTNVDFINPQEEATYKDKSREKDKINDKNYLYKTEKKKQKKNLIMNMVKENIEEENNEENKDKNNINEEVLNINKDIEEKKEEDPVISHINLQGKILDDDIKNSSKLIIEEIDGNLFNGEKIEINASGMVGGRGKNDGFTIFGQKNINKEDKSDSNSKNNNENNLNNINNQKGESNFIFKPDFELNINENLFYPYIFAIYYKKEKNSYYIRAFSGKGSDNKILFIKLKNKCKFVLKQKELISAGDKIFQITPIENNCLEIIHLLRKKVNNNCHKEIFDGTKNKKVTLGRSKDCDFSFPKDKSFSRFQTTFEFDENKKEWSIVDGKENKSSTNGTWIFGTHSFLIKEEMIVEILSSKIKITEIKKENINDKVHDNNDFNEKNDEANNNKDNNEKNDIKENNENSEKNGNI